MSPLTPVRCYPHRRPATPPQAAVCGAGELVPPPTLLKGNTSQHYDGYYKLFNQYVSLTVSPSIIRMGCSTIQSPCSPTPRQPDQCRRLKTCSECLARHPKTFSVPSQVTFAAHSHYITRSGTERIYLKSVPGLNLQPALQCKWCTNCPEGACISSNVSCTSEHDCRINQREIFLSSNCTETSCEASDCPKCTASGKCMWTRQFKRTGTEN